MILIMNHCMPFPSFPEIAPSAYAMALGVVFVAAIVQSAIGMGFGQVAAPLLLLINADFVPVPILIMGMAVATLRSVKGRQEVALGELGLALSGRIVGSVVAAVVLVHVAGQTAFSLLFAGLVLLGTGYGSPATGNLPSLSASGDSFDQTAPRLLTQPLHPVTHSSCTTLGDMTLTNSPF